MPTPFVTETPVVHDEMLVGPDTVADVGPAGAGGCVGHRLGVQVGVRCHAVRPEAFQVGHVGVGEPTEAGTVDADDQGLVGENAVRQALIAGREDGSRDTDGQCERRDCRREGEPNVAVQMHASTSET